MKPSKGGVTPNRSCSSTSCLYRSESDRPSLRRIIAQGSKIDKLYYGKYIPLRERKLLDKLVRTRAVYDDIRTQLLSGSSISISLADLKPRKKMPTNKIGRNAQRGGDIPALVNLVDKGNILLSEKSSDCCSCCPCGSELGFGDETSKSRIYKRRERARITSKSSVMSRQRVGEEIKLGKAVQFKTKHVRSDPCTCTYKFSEMMKRHSVLKKIRKNKPEPVLETLAGAPEQTMPNKHNSINKSIDRVKQSKTRLIESIQEGTRKSVTMIRETKTKMKENLEALAKKSMEKMQDKIETSKQKQDFFTQKPEEVIEEKPFKIRKDSLTKFREKLRRKRDLKDWECDFECRPEDCVPEKCFKIITRKRLRKIKDASVRPERTNVEARAKKNADKLKVSETSIQAQQIKKSIEPSKRKRTSRKIETGRKPKLDPSCLCVEIKKKVTNNTKERRKTVPGKNNIKTKSETSLPQKPKGSPQAAPATSYNNKESKIPKKHSSGLKVANLKVPKQIKNTEMSSKARQAVRVGSSFSFNIEFYKETPIARTSELKTRQEVKSIIRARQQLSNTKDGQNRAKKVYKKDKGSETTLNQSIKNVQVTGHPLKRCFCTLKLRPRKTKTPLNVDKSTKKKCVCPCTTPVIVKTETESFAESIQTNKMSESLNVLEPYKCEPIYIIEECDPIECGKRIRKRNKKHHSVSINTKKQMKSSSSITTKSAMSATSRGFQVHPVQQPVTPHQREPASMYITAAQNSLSSQRQAVRIGSSFSFQIEFSKGKHINNPAIDNQILKEPDFKMEQIVVDKPKREKSVSKAKRYINHKYSEISSSTKTKFKSQKHKLRRCFCTLKLNKAEKKKKIISTSKGTITSVQSDTNESKPQPEVKTVSMATKKMRKSKVLVEPELLSYECEQDICIPGYCDPHECLEIIKKREIKELRTKAHTSNTDYRKTKSTSSFAPKSIIRSKTKKVQSTLVTYENQVPRSKSAKKKYTPRKSMQFANKVNKQAVRIGSSFSFNIEFYKDISFKDLPIKVSQPSKNFINQDKKLVHSKERASQMGNISPGKSVLMQAVTKRKNVPIDPAMKRCFCTLKLRKLVKDAKKDFVTVGTKTQHFKTKHPKFPQLEPYECEPNVCTTGECNPYECLERIKKRKINISSREIGVIAKPSRMKSTSSSGQSVRFADAIAQSKTVKQKFLTKQIKREAVTSDHLPKMQKSYAKKQRRQSVRLGSNWSFDIEFHKDRKSDENQVVPVPRDRGEVQKSFGVVMRQHESQVNVKKVHRATGVTPMLKRCFCTLQLQKKNKPPTKAQVFTVSRVSVTKPSFLHKQRMSGNMESFKTILNKNSPYNIGNTIALIQNSDFFSSTVMSDSTVNKYSKRVQPYCSNNLCHGNHAYSITGHIFSQPIFRLHSYISTNDNKCTKSTKGVRSLCTKNSSPTHYIKKFSELSLVEYEFYASNKNKRNPNKVSTYLRRQFCAMNMQLPDNYKTLPYTHKLKPYECEPGVCVPYECDPWVCQDRIMKRLKKSVSKSSETQKRLHSASSSTLYEPHRSKRLQSNASFAPTRKTQSPSTLRQKTGYSGSSQQAVRVGSNFSFNIEFYKEHLKPTNVSKDVTHKPSRNKRQIKTVKVNKNRGTGGYHKRHIDKDSQSMAKMEHRGSNAKPILKRCFCTLKLHKKDTKEKNKRFTDDKRVAVNNEIITVQTVDSNQNTEPLKYRKLRHSLEPYECEPGVCVPGACDPYECLELIKKRKLRGKDFGSGPIKLGRTSTGSMTPSQKRKMKNRCNQLNCKEKRQRVQKYKQSAESIDFAKPSRQAVRIGSTFSFNVEFFKENPSMPPRPSIATKNIVYKSNTKTNRPWQTYDFKERFTQDARSIHPKDSQSDFVQPNIKSTMTSSFLKRCFCTAKLNRKGKTISPFQDQTMNVNIEKQSSGLPSFLQRCLCVMKSLTAPKYKTGTSSQTEHNIGSEPVYEPPSNRLKPYECTPGVCVPGECEQLIRKRNAKVLTKETCTRRLKTRSHSSRAISYKAPKAKQTQMTVDTSSRMVKPSSSGDFEKRKHMEYSGSPGRKAVKIGSNFNFNIEFYKDRPTIETFQDRSATNHRRGKCHTCDDSRSYRPKTKSRSSLERKNHRRSRDSQVHNIKKQDQASGVGPLLQRCFCTLNLRKPKVPKNYSETATQSMRMAAVREPPNTDTKSVMTIQKRSPCKLERYECEPNTCIPGQCDPYKCEKRIKKRLRRVHGTSTAQLKTKSATSMASSARKLKNMKIQSKQKKSHRQRTTMAQPQKSSYNKLDLPSTPSRQAVRIGSSFSFNIEFCKENSNDTKILYKPEPKFRNKDVGDLDRSFKKRYSVPCNTKTCQAKPRMREVDSQVLAKKMRSTMSGVTPFLKRCFCTLKLQKPVARAQSENSQNQTQPWVDTGNKSTYTRISKKINKSQPPVRAQRLDPYECEPGVCVPGQCDPYECEKRIQMSDIRSHSVSSNTGRCKDNSKCVAASTRYKHKKSHATSVPRERQRQKLTMSDKPRPVVQQSDLKSGYSPHRKAVHIGSNFSFDIEFYKDKSAIGPPKKAYPQNNFNKTRDTARVRESSKLKTKNTEAGNRGISFYHRKSQAYGPKRESKESGVGPFLKRCFCTLKLHKQGKQQKQSSDQMQVDYSPQPSAFDATTTTKKQRRALEPYECEPNVCVPGYCDPNECLRRIKRRQMKESGVATDRASMKSDYSLTSKVTTRDQSLKIKHSRDARLKKYIYFDKKPRSKPMRRSFANASPNRQAVRIGSSFKFDIEFYKQTSTPNDQAHGDGQSYDDSPVKEQIKRHRKLKNRGSQGKCSPHCQGVQMKGTQRQSRGSGMAPLLKRCFCTLALQNTSKQPDTQKQTKLMKEAKTRNMCTQSKCNFNKSKSLPYALEQYECEPNICVPGECDPYECYDRIKKRNARYKSKGLVTNSKRYSQASSMTTKHGKKCHSQRTQSVLLDKHRPQHRSSVNDSMIIEKPRLQLFSDIANRNVVRVGSNFSFNIEFYKEVAPAAKMNFNNSNRERRATIHAKPKYTYKTTNYRSRDSQAQTPKTHNKGSLVSNALKRCFCTAQLHKPDVATLKTDVSRKCEDCKPKPVFGPQEYHVYYHKTSIKKKISKKCMCTTCDMKICPNTKPTSTKSLRRIRLKRYSTIKSKKIQNANEMETILPYAPKKFNKKTSKTLIQMKDMGIAGEETAKTQFRKSKQDTISKNRKLKKSKSSKKLNVKKGKYNEPEGKDAITSTSSNLNNKSFLCRCKEFFSKTKNQKNTGTKPCADICPMCKFDKTNKEPELKQGDNLKKTKSERRPNKPNKKEPKKSKSLKISNQRDLEEDRQAYSQFQSGDTKRKKRSLATNKRKDNILPDEYKTNLNNLRCGDDYLYLYVTDLNQKLIKDNKKQVKFSVPNSDGIPASANLTPKSVRKDKMPSKKKEKKSGVRKPEVRKANCRTDSESYLDIVLQPSYCSGTQLEGIAAVSFKGDNKSKSKRKSLQEKDAPCIPFKKKVGDGFRGASLSIAAKGPKKQSATPGGDIEQIIDKLTKNINTIKNAKSRILNTLITKEQICSCYSSVCECAKAIRKEKERARKIEMELEEEKCLMAEREQRRKESEKAAKKKHKEFLMRIKRYEREDAKRRQKRLKENKYLAQRLKTVKTSDVLLAADSIMDIAKLGCSVVGDVGRSTCRFITDPGYSCRRLKASARDPVSMVKGAIDDSGLVATLKRVFMRISSMRGFRSMKSSLEDNQFTGYLMKVAEGDPRKRMKLKKKKEAKKKQPAIDDFECSLYMASLRRKRFLSVYYLCPWFYPHFITLLNVVEQVTDLILFLLAVFVWSPCILCMELCRAFVCCFFCTG